MVIKSAKFDDVYFSVDGGLDETHHVFMSGNDLPQAWQDKDAFIIAETGFGTGLNFLCVWQSFEATRQPHQKLHFISVEKYPLSKAEIRNALTGWDDVLGAYIDTMLAHYPIRVPGPHDIDINDYVRLTIWFDDVNDCIQNWTGQVDAWFLDGFTPAKNPDMWSDVLFSNMARLSHAETTYATFTAAGFVRQGLSNAGFSVEKTKGFGRKRDMVRGCFGGENAPHCASLPKKIAIIGGGLAGCALAHAFLKCGDVVILYEAADSLAVGASGGRLGMINPKLTAKPSAHSDYYMAAYANALRQLAGLGDIDYSVHGSLHLCTDEDKDRKFTGYIENLGWHADHIERRGEDLYYPEGASVCPYKLCHALAVGAEIQLNSRIQNLNEIDADIVILANGYDMSKLVDGVDLQAVRGQVSWVKPQSGVENNICFGGYITPLTSEGFHILGSSFEPWSSSTDVTIENHIENIDRYNKVIDTTISMDDVIGGWAALRTASKDRFPIVGHVRDNIYASTAHGSHGIISSLMAAKILVNQIHHAHVPASGAVRQALSPERFYKL